MAEIDLRKQNYNNVRDMLPHKPMRLSMENKNLLSEKGDIYVGTGKSQTVTIEDDTYIIAETDKVSVPSELSSNESAILIYDKTNNLQYKKSSESGFVTYGVGQSLTDEQKSTARNNIGAAAVSDLTFLSYKVDQTKIFVDSSEQGSSLKTTLLNNIFYGLTEDQKSSVRLNIGAGSAQGIAGITAGNGIKVDSNTPSSPKVSVNLAQNSGLVCDSSSSGKLKLNVNSSSQSGNKYWVQIDSSNNHPYVNVSVPSGANQTIAYAPSTTSSISEITAFGNNATVKLVPGNNISMAVSQTNNYIKIDATDTKYSAAVGGGIKLEGTSFSLDTGIITTNKDYAVALNNEGVPYVHVPWVEYTGGNGISVSNGAISVNLADNSGLVFSSNQLKLNIGNVTGEKNYAVQLENGIPYVNVPWTDTTYTGGNGISVSGETISLAEGYNVPIEYQASASSTVGFTPNKLYLIGTWGV